MEDLDEIVEVLKEKRDGTEKKFEIPNEKYSFGNK